MAGMEFVCEVWRVSLLIKIYLKQVSHLVIVYLQVRQSQVQLLLHLRIGGVLIVYVVKDSGNEASLGILHNLLQAMHLLGCKSFESLAATWRQNRVSRAVSTWSKCTAHHR